MTISIHSFKPRAQRSLKRLSAFKELNEHEVIKNLPIISERIFDEGLIGLYQNEHDSFVAGILFSNSAIYIHSNEEWVRIGYDEIIDLQPDMDKATASCIGLVLSSQKVQKVIISGVEGKYRDYHTVYQFLHRIIGDLSS